MALKANTNKTYYEYAVESTGEKPSPRPVGCKLTETDTFLVYKYLNDEIGWTPDPSGVVYGRGVDENGGYILVPIIVNQFGYLVPLDYVHNLVHEKIVHTMSHTFLNVAVAGFSRVRIKTGSKALHFEINFNADLKCRIRTISGVTILTAGTLKPSFNRVIGYTDSTFESLFYLNPTFSGGTQRANDFSGSNSGTGARGTRAGGGKSGGIESILPPNQEFIIEFQNAGIDPTDIGVVINCYERPYI